MTPPAGLFRLMSGYLAFPAKPSALRQRAGPSPLLQRLAVADCPRRDRLDARTRSRARTCAGVAPSARTCAGVAPSLEHHDPKSLTLSGYEEFVLERARVIDESYGPGFSIGRPSPPRGIPVPIPHPGPYPLFSSRTEKPKSTLQSQCFSVSGYAGWLG
jgi:hypothetical protein